MVITQDFFNRPTIIVARDLLGKFLVCRLNNKMVSLMLHEIEAYDGPDDKACHASKGRTNRTEVMFGSAGHFYVYLIYGMHWMLNVVTGPKGYPAALLIRGAGEVCGPGRLTKALSIDHRLNAKAALPATGVWFEDRNVKISDRTIVATPRIGVNYAGPLWANKRYRFVYGLNKTSA